MYDVIFVWKLKTSVSTDMLKDRRLHQNRLTLMEPQAEVIKYLDNAGFGSKKHRESFETVVASTEWDSGKKISWLYVWIYMYMYVCMHAYPDTSLHTIDGWMDGLKDGMVIFMFF